MLESIIYLSPLIVLLSGIFILIFSEHEENEQYGCFKISKVMMLTAFALTVIFYNKPLIFDITSGSKFTLMFECMMYGCGFSLLYLSRKWFSSMNVSGYLFCGGLFVVLLFGSILIRSNNLLLSIVCCIFMMLGNYSLLQGEKSKKSISDSDKLYLSLIIVCIALLGTALLCFYQYGESFDYTAIKEVLSLNKPNPFLFIAASSVVIALMFLLGLAPMHFWFTETSGSTILPVFAYFIMFPICGVLGGFIRINIEVFTPFSDDLYLFYKSIALISISLGALGACSGRSIRKILAYGTVYHLGIILLVIQNFSLNAVNAGIIYALVYLLSMYGICTCLFGLKIKGEYLYMLEELEGAAYKRPYISAMMTIFIFSLLGIPPFLGFLGVFSALSYLAKHDSFYQFGYIMVMLIVLSYGYLQIIKNLYFEKSKENYDRSDVGIYVTILLTALLMIIIMLQPHYLLQDISLMTEGIFQ